MSGALYIGLMSGTSMDAVDAALLRFEPRLQLLGHHSLPLPDALREALRRLAAERSPHPLQCLGELDAHIGELFAECTLALLKQSGLEGNEVAAIGSHGQTLYHAPHGDTPFTLQIGDANRIAARTGITTVADFRRRDIALGGQGAPLVPAFHKALWHSEEEDRAVLNIGGIANLSLLPAAPDVPVRGFDTGPGNTLMDAWCREQRGEPYDSGGAWAAGGEVDEALLSSLLSDDYFSASAPKSTGPEYFSSDWLKDRLSDQPVQTVQATLLELTARSIAEALQREAPATRRLIACGGGINNSALMARLASLLPAVTVESSTAHGLDPQWVEAAAFAWLARETLAGRPGNLPEVTGASAACVLGAIYPA